MSSGSRSDDGGVVRGVGGGLVKVVIMTMKSDGRGEGGDNDDKL